MANNTPISLDLETQIIRVPVQLQPAAVGKGACVAVIIQNTLTNLESTAAPQAGNAIEVMLGGGAGQMYQLLPGQDSPVYYCTDLEEVYLRVREAVGVVNTVNVTVVTYKRRVEKR